MSIRSWYHLQSTVSGFSRKWQSTMNTKVIDGVFTAELTADFCTAAYNFLNHQSKIKRDII